MDTVHQPILLEELGAGVFPAWPASPALEKQPGGVIVDLTFGGGGHTRWFLQRGCRVMAWDQDQQAVDRGLQAFANEIQSGQLILKRGRWSEVAAQIVAPVCGLVADLGFSSDQMDDLERGLSFRSTGPLDMRMDRTRERTAQGFLELATESEMADVFYQFGEERMSRKIARMIAYKRNAGILPKSPAELADWVAGCVGYPKHKSSRRIHPATRVFQALRIWVNDEMGELDALCKHVLPLVVSGGRVGIITFHSLEDRVIKRTFQDREQWTKLTKKPVVPSDLETERNPRSRSAKLRLAEHS